MTSYCEGTDRTLTCFSYKMEDITVSQENKFIRTNSNVSVINYGKSLPCYFTVFTAKRKLDSQLILTLMVSFVL